MSDGGYEIIVVGASWGGLAALRTLAGELPREFGLPIAVVQHRHKDSDRLLATVLQDHTALTVCEVEDKQPLQSGFLFIAPADYHLLVERGHFSLSTDAPVRYSRPSIDVAFTSAADSYGARAVGVVLTGANADGAEGLARIVERGGLAVVQSPATAESPTMPSAALEAVPSARVLTIPAIADLLRTLTAAAPSPRPEARQVGAAPEHRP